MKTFTRTLALVCLWLASHYAASAETATLTEWSLPQVGSGPAYLALDGRGGFWFTQQDAARLGHFDPATGTLTEWEDPSPFFNFGITVDEAGFVWIAAWSRALVRFDPLANRFETFDIPTAFPIPFMVHVEAQVCTTQFFRDVVACLDPDARVWLEWRLPASHGSPEGLAGTPDGALWIGSNDGRRIARLDRPSSVLTSWTIPGDGALRLQLAQDALGRVWFPLIEDGALGRLDPSSDEITIFPLPNPYAEPFALEVDRLGRVWFTEGGHAGNAIGRLDLSGVSGQVYTVAPEVFALSLGHATSKVGDYGFELPAVQMLQAETLSSESLTTGAFHEWLLPTPAAGPGDLEIDDQGRVLFLEYASDKLGMLTLELDAIVSGIADTLAGVVEAILATQLSGGQGLSAKLTQISAIVTDASDAFASGSITFAEYQHQLRTALDLLHAFENHLEAKIANGQLGDPEASELPPLVAGIEQSIVLLMGSN